VSLKTPKAVHSVSERKYIAAGGDIQVPWGSGVATHWLFWLYPGAHVPGGGKI